MPRDLVLTPTYPAAINYPSGSDASDALTWAVPLQDLGNRSEFSAQRMVSIANLLAARSALTASVAEFESDGKWIKPVGAQLIYIAVVDGGGGGGGGANDCGGFGGQSGSFVHGWLYVGDVPPSLQVEVGDGGKGGGRDNAGLPGRPGGPTVLTGADFTFGTYRGGRGVEITDETAAMGGRAGGEGPRLFSSVYRLLRIASAGGAGQGVGAAVAGQHGLFTGGAVGTSSGTGKAGGGGGGGFLKAHTGVTPTQSLPLATGGQPGNGKGGGGGGGCFDTATKLTGAGGPGNPGYATIVTFGIGQYAP